MNKKGNFLDWFYIIAVLFMTGICIFVATIIINKADTSGMFAGDADAQAVVDSAKQTILSLDNMMMFIIVGLSIFVLVSSAMVYNHPAFFICGIFLLFIACVVAAITSNTFWTFANSEQIAATSALYPKINFLMDHLPYYVIFMGIAASIAAYIGYNKQ